MLSPYFEQICDTLRDAHCVTDREGTVVLVNRRHFELTGIPKEDILGHRVQDMVQEGIFDTVLNPRVVETGEKISGVQNLFNGRTLLLDANPVKDLTGRVIYVVTVTRDVTVLHELAEEVTTQRELLQAFQALSNDAVADGQYPHVVQSQAMQRLYAEAGAIAATDATLLLLGETGTGKDVIARHVHRQSPRADAPFIKVDCGSMPEHLIETELFGYVSGSFSGANRSGKAGLVEAASAGKLFLDEIGELPMTMQTRLLRLLQDFEVQRVGSTTPKRVDVRIIAATNKELEHEVAVGNFRSDLFYRLKVTVLTVPPLRKRRADIVPLARGFLQYYTKKYNKAVAFAPEVEQILQKYAWPGNVRELENLVQGLVVICKGGRIDASALSGICADGAAMQGSNVANIPPIEGRSFKSIMKEVERAVILLGMQHYGSVGTLAQHFQMDRSTIFRKVKEMEAVGMLPSDTSKGWRKHRS